jgi:hypothetical protein
VTALLRIRVAHDSGAPVVQARTQAVASVRNRRRVEGPGRGRLGRAQCRAQSTGEGQAGSITNGTAEDTRRQEGRRGAWRGGRAQGPHGQEVQEESRRQR